MTENLVRAVVVVMLVGASAAKAADISGTLSATFEGVNEFGVPSVKLDLNLACALTCPPSAPTLHYGVAGGVAGKFAGDPTTTAGYSSAFFGSDPTGVNSTVTTSFPTGSAFFVQAKSATCWCGNANGQGGFIDLQTGTVTIPPRMLLDATAKLTDSVYVNLYARPMGTDTIDVRLQGAGFDEVRTLPATAFGSSSSGSAQLIFQPKQAGTIAVTATLQPYGASSAVSQILITEKNASATGGGTGATGGGSGGGGSDAEPSGCATTPGLLLAAVALLLRQRGSR